MLKLCMPTLRFSWDKRFFAYSPGSVPRQGSGADDLPPVHSPKTSEITLSDDDRFIQACIQVAKKRRGLEPSRIARQAKGWTSERWEAAYMAYSQKQFDRYAVTDVE